MNNWKGFAFAYSKICLKRPLKRRPKIEISRQKTVEHSVVLLTCIALPHGFKTFVLSIFEWPLKTGFTVQCMQTKLIQLGSMI